MLSYQTFATFPSLCYLHTLCYFINFCRLNKLSSFYQIFIIFSPFLIYSLFKLSTHPINVPAVYTTNTTLSPVLSCARSLRHYTFLTHQASLAIVPFWLWGDRTVAWGFLIEQAHMLPSVLIKLIVPSIGTGKWISGFSKPKLHSLGKCTGNRADSMANPDAQWPVINVKALPKSLEHDDSNSVRLTALYLYCL